MKRIRIGKDINVQWVLHAPTDIILTTENLTIELKSPKGNQATVNDYVLETLSDGKFAVYFVLRGTAFSLLGNYTFTAWLNKGEQGQSVVDAVNAFTLVGSTQSEDDITACGCGCLDTATLDIRGDIAYVGQRGEKGDKGDKGDKGEDGDFGLVATEIDANGHLILYSTSDTLDFAIVEKHLVLTV